MKFRTEIELKPFEKKIDYNSQILSIGSCFAQEVASKLEEMRFRTTINPTGTLFNPASIYSTLLRFAEKRLLKDSELRHHQDIYFSYDFHSSLNGINACEVLENINNVISENHERLAKTDWVIITFGTAWYTSSTRVVRSLPTARSNRHLTSLDADCQSRRLSRCMTS